MLAHILGILWIVLGILWFIWPGMLRSRLKRRMVLRVKWITYGFAIILCFSFIGSIIRAEGLLLKIAGIAGLIITIRVISLMASKSAERIVEWWHDKPLIFFRLWGLLVFAAGLLLLYGRRSAGPQ